MRLIQRKNAFRYLILAVIAMCVAGYGFMRDLKPPIEISSINELNAHLGEKVRFIASEIVDTGHEFTKVNSKNGNNTIYHFYSTSFDTDTIVLISNGLKTDEKMVSITGIVVNMNSPVGQEYEFFRNANSHYWPYHEYGISVISDNIIVLDIIVASVSILLLVFAILCFLKKPNKSSQKSETF